MLLRLDYRVSRTQVDVRADSLPRVSSENQKTLESEKGKSEIMHLHRSSPVGAMPQPRSREGIVDSLCSRISDKHFTPLSVCEVLLPNIILDS